MSATGGVSLAARLPCGGFDPGILCDFDYGRILAISLGYGLGYGERRLGVSIEMATALYQLAQLAMILGDFSDRVSSADEKYALSDCSGQLNKMAVELLIRAADGQRPLVFSNDPD